MTTEKLKITLKAARYPIPWDRIELWLPFIVPVLSLLLANTNSNTMTDIRPGEPKNTSHILVISLNFITQSITAVNVGTEGETLMPSWINTHVWSIRGAPVTADSLIAYHSEGRRKTNMKWVNSIIHKSFNSFSVHAWQKRVQILFIYSFYRQPTIAVSTTRSLLCIQMKTLAAILIIYNKTRATIGIRLLICFECGGFSVNYTSAESQWLQGDKLRIDATQTHSGFSKQFGAWMHRSTNKTTRIRESCVVKCFSPNPLRACLATLGHYKAAAQQYLNAVFSQLYNEKEVMVLWEKWKFASWALLNCV